MNESHRESLSDYYRYVQNDFYSDFRHASIVQKHYSLAGVPITIKYGDERVAAAFMPTLAMRERRGAAVGLIIHVWDRKHATTAVELTEPLRDQLFGDERNKGMLDDDAIRMSFAVDAQALSLLNSAQSTACYYLRDVGELPLHSRAEPFLQLIYWWLAKFERHLLHAACVGLDGNGALLVGRSGQGKSTSSLACLDAGFQFVGDDKCLYHADGSHRASALYSACKLEPSHAHNFPSLARYTISRTSNRLLGYKEKSVMILNGRARNTMVESLKIRAILVPSVTQQQIAEVVPASPGEALRALAPSTLKHYAFPLGEDARFAILANIVRQIPAFHLRLGADLHTIPDAVSKALSLSTDGKT